MATRNTQSVFTAAMTALGCHEMMVTVYFPTLKVLEELLKKSSIILKTCSRIPKKFPRGQEFIRHLVFEEIPGGEIDNH